MIYNGVDTDVFSPKGKGNPPTDFIRLLVVEGSFKGGHERDLFNAVEAANRLSARLDRKVELLVAGNAPQEMRKQVVCSHKATVRWMGLVPHKDIPELDRSAHLLFPAEINAACPNSVVEALASGLPVVSYARFPAGVDRRGGRRGGALWQQLWGWKTRTIAGGSRRESVGINCGISRFARQPRRIPVRLEKMVGITRKFSGE